MTTETEADHKQWSAWYDEDADNFEEFVRFEMAEDLPQRQISGSVVEEEAAKDWEEDWEDEDKEDTFTHITGLLDAQAKK